MTSIDINIVAVLLHESSAAVVVINALRLPGYVKHRVENGV